MFILFLKGVLIGFAIAAPVGPIGILCIQRSLNEGFKIGLMTGLGAALADGVYGLVAGFGLTAISSFLINHQFWIRLFGGLFLIYLGIKLLVTSPKKEVQNHLIKLSAFQALNTSFFLTLTNPATILSFIAIFTGFGVGKTNLNYVHAIILVLSIILGSTLWWILLSSSVSFMLHHRIKPSMMKMINQMSAIIILSFGIITLTRK